MMKLYSEAIKAMNKCAKDAQKNMKRARFDEIEQSISDFNEIKYRMDEINELFEPQISEVDAYEVDNLEDLEDIISVESKDREKDLNI
jgi:tetrahydromethanopterin S-methyltransferase subunit G